MVVDDQRHGSAAVRHSEPVLEEAVYTLVLIWTGMENRRCLTEVIFCL